MNTTVTATQMRHMLRAFFPNVDYVDIMDEVCDTLAQGQTATIAREYHADMHKLGLGQWQRNKRDCDKAARLCVAHTIIRNALSDAVNAKAIGTVSYLINGDPQRAHMINIGIERRGTDGMQLVTVEPEGGRGEVTLSLAERHSAWRASL